MFHGSLAVGQHVQALVHIDVLSTCTSSSGTLMLFAGGIGCCHDGSSPLALPFGVHST